MLFKKKHNRIPSEFRRKPWFRRLPESINNQTNAVIKLVSKPFQRRRSSYPRKSFSQRLNEWIDGRIHGAIKLAIWLQRSSKSWRLRVPVWLLIPAVFILGAGLSFLVMKQRRASSEVIVVVKGEPISEPQFFHRMEMEVGPQVLNKMVTEQLTMEFAQQRHVLPTQAAIKARVKQVKMQPGFDEFAKSRHWTPEDVEQQCRMQLAQENLFGKNVTVSDEEAMAYYRSQCDPKNPQAQFYIPDTTHLAVIVTSTEADSRKAYQELQQGKLFAEVAKKYSQDRTGIEGGTGMPPLIRGRSQFAAYPAFEREIFQLNPGDRLGMRKCLGVWWIMECKDRTAAYTIPFETVKEQCRHAAQVEKAAKTNAAQVEADFEQFRKKSNVQVFWEQYYYDLTGREARLGAVKK